MPNYGLCADCDKEVELMQNGCCSICQSESTMKRGAITELELAISNKQAKSLALCLAIANIMEVQIERQISILEAPQLADDFIRALEDYKNV